MSYDLLTERWLTGRRRSGAIERLSPAEVTSRPEDPFVDLVAPRPDLRAGGYTFLIGLLQTVLEPDTERTWAKRAKSPPTSEELARTFASAAGKFDLRHPQTPFLQEPAIDDELNEPQGLLFASPTGQTLEQNRDLFTKRRGPARFCRACSALALYTLQAFAQSGGRGHRTSIRGGGPLSAAIMGSTLWETLWFNVLPQETWLPGHARTLDATSFPWLNVPRLPALPVVTLNQSSAPIHYWAMPRRVKLGWHDAVGSCDLCGENDQALLIGYATRANGFDYHGSWDHPLSPTYEHENERLCVKGREDPAGYRYWRGLILNDATEGRRPAPVVRHLITERAPRLERFHGWRVWVSGLATDKATVKGWYESTIPRLDIPAVDRREAFEKAIERLIASAEIAQTYLAVAVKKAVKPAKPPRRTAAHFWSMTEPHFHDFASRVATEDVPDLAERWHRVLFDAAMGCFESAVPVADIAHADAARVAKAERGLEKNLRGRRLRAALGEERAQPTEMIV